MKSSWTLALLIFVVLGLTACGGDKTGDQQGTEQTTGDQSSEGTKPAPGKTEQPRKPEPPPEPQMVTRLMTVAAGEEIVASLQQELSTKEDKAGQTFTATTKEAVKVNGVAVIPAGSTVHGQVTLAKRAPNLGGKAKMTMEYTQLVLPNGKSYTLLAEPLSLEGESTTSGDVQKVLGGAVGGAILGGVLGGKKGAVKGAAGGAAAGTVFAVATKGKDIVLEPGTEVAVVLSREIKIPVEMRSDQLP